MENIQSPPALSIPLYLTLQIIFMYNVFRQYATSYRKQEKIIPYIHLTILVVDFIKSPKKLCWSRAQVTFVRLLRAKVMWCFTCV